MYGDEGSYNVLTYVCVFYSLLMNSNANPLHTSSNIWLLFIHWIFVTEFRLYIIVESFIVLKQRCGDYLQQVSLYKHVSPKI